MRSGSAEWTKFGSRRCEADWMMHLPTARIWLFSRCLSAPAPGRSWPRMPGPARGRKHVGTQINERSTADRGARHTDQQRGRTPALIVAVADDVDHVPVWVAHEEPAYSPRFVGQRMNDLVAASLRLRVGLIDVTPDVYRDHGVLRTRQVPRHELDARSPVRRPIAGHPSEVHLLHVQPEVIGIEAARGVDVADRQVRRDSRYSHIYPLRRDGFSHRQTRCRPRRRSA